LVAGNNYSIRLLTSVIGQVSVYRNATANNWSRALVTTTTAAPVATDILITVGSYTSAGVNTTTTVTMNSTAATQYGQCYIGSNGIFNYGVATSTNYVLRLLGDLWVGRGGTFTIGTVASPIPATSTAILEINCASALQFQIYNFGTLETKYATTVIHRALLAADIAVGATTMTTDIQTLWKQNDSIVIPSTTRTTSSFERRVLSSNASGTTLNMPATSFAHDGNAAIYMQADLANLTRSIKIRSVSGTFKTRFQQGLIGVTTLFDVEFFEMSTFVHSSGTSTYAGTFNVQQCTFWQTVSPGTTTLFSNLNTITYNLSNNVFYNYAEIAGTLNDNNLIIGFTGFVAHFGGTLGNNNVITSNGQAGSQNPPLSGTTGNRFYANGGNGGIYISSNNAAFTISNYVFFNNTIAIRYISSNNTIATDRTSFEKFENCYFYGNTENISMLGSGVGLSMNPLRKLWFNNCFFWAGKTGLLTAIGYSAIPNDHTHFTNCTFGRRPDGVVSNFTTSCVRGGQVGTTFTNCFFSGTEATFASTNIFTSVNGFNGITSLKHDQITNEYRQYQSNGSIENDNIITFNGLPTVRIIPAVATNKTFSNPVRIAVQSGQTCNISVNIRKSGGLDTLYTGNQPRLMYAFNPLAGNLTETVAATPSITNNLILGTAPENFSTFPWNGFGMTVTQNSTAAPNGIVNADTFTATGTSFVYRAYPVVKAASAITYTASIYAKKGTNDWIRFGINDENQNAQVWFNLNTGVAGSTLVSAPFILNSYSIEPVGNGWYLLTVNATTSTLPIVVMLINFADGNGSSNTSIGGTYFLWGAQLVVGGAQTYIPEGSWQTLSYTTPVVDHDSVLEFYIDCDGTAGWINIDDFITTTSNDTRGMKYWSSIGVYSEPDWRRPGGTVTFVT
jgi:hypothetical protein